jgi:hypothetical protein
MRLASQLFKELVADVVRESQGEDILGVLVVAILALVLAEPRVEEGPPADIRVVNEEDTTS